MNIDMEDFGRRIAQLQFKNSRKQRMRVYRKLEGMLRMNEALSRALDRLFQNASEMGKYPNRPAARALREWFLKDRAGQGLSEAMDGWVPDADIYMIRAGEESGAMAKSLKSIQTMGERAKQMRAAVTYAIAYPGFMLLLVAGVLWMFGVQLIQNMRKTAPPSVMAAMGGVGAVSDFIANWGIWILVGIFVAVIIIAVTMPVWTGKIRIKLDKYPPWAWYRVVQGSGFLLGLSSLLGSQVPLKRALEILEEQARPWLRERVHAARQEVLRGRNLGEALRTGGYNFPDPSVAIDLEILSERADVGTVIEEVTDEWIEDQIEMLQAQAVVARNVGLVVVAGTIVWAFRSVFAVVEAVSKTGSGGGGMM
ncbi:MAG: type II secretion system F family protein [Alphaproteobacteria bacterium]|nr:type II secretion system F family protein [Alphaproteobacteria bacterium]